MYYVGLFESKDGSRFRIMHTNGNIIATSEAYSNMRERDDTVIALSTQCGLKIRNMDNGTDLMIKDSYFVPVDEETVMKDEKVCSCEDNCGQKQGADED